MVTGEFGALGAVTVIVPVEVVGAYVPAFTVMLKEPGPLPLAPPI